MLTIAEELLLLALDDYKGTVVPAAWNSLNYGLAGAILADLTLKNKISLDNKKVIVIDNEKTEEPVLDEVLDQILSTSRCKSIKRWIERIAPRFNATKQQMLKRFVQKGILHEQEKRFFFIFTRKTYLTEQQRYEKEIRSRIDKSLEEEKAPDAKTAILLSLIKACNLINEIFPKEERKTVNKKIDKIVKDDQYEKAVRDTVTAMQAGIITATTAATAAAAAGSAGAQGGSGS